MNQNIVFNYIYDAKNGQKIYFVEIFANQTSAAKRGCIITKKAGWKKSNPPKFGYTLPRLTQPEELR